MFTPSLLDAATTLLALCTQRHLRLAVAESCTGGLVGALITECAGASAVLERGFITYSNDAKIELLGVAPALIQTNGAVSAACALAMAQGALQNSKADLAIAITGIAGPEGGSPEKPVGTVHIALAARKNLSASQQTSWHIPCLFVAQSRTDVRINSALTALTAMKDLIQHQDFRRNP